VARAGFLAEVFVPKGPPRVVCAVFLSGNRTSSEFRDGNVGPLHGFRAIHISFIMSKLSCCYHWPLWCKTNRSQEGAMIHRTLILHYRLVREAIATLVTIGAALLFSYLILWARL